MARVVPKLPKIPESERTPVVIELVEICSLLQEQVRGLRDEIARLKGEKPRPKIKPSGLEKGGGGGEGKGKGKGRKKRRGSSKRRKTRKLDIHETRVIQPEDVPAGSRFKGYQDFTVQDIVIRPHITRYRLERWLTPSGEYLVGKLPAEVEGGHFGPTLVSYVLYLYYQAHVTQPLIWEHLREMDVDISKGQVNRLITEGNDHFHAEKDDILRVGLEVSSHIHVDDTGARHRGRNGYCTHIGNDLFAWFASTESKSRVNFLELLRAERQDYVLNGDAIAYMLAHKLPKAQLELLAAHEKKSFADQTEWAAALEALQVTSARHVRIATEGALFGAVLEHGLNPELAIVSDDAGQFKVFLHALCWVHAERTIYKLVGFTDEQREALADVRTRIWALYADLKRYKENPSDDTKAKLEERFDELFTTKTCFASLNLALKRLHANKAELLLVLDRPDVPLHNNLSERDIREYVKKRKISGSTRSDLGRRCRDTFASLKKTCRKLGVSFWDYLNDRVLPDPKIPPLGQLIRAQSQLPET